MADPAAMTSKRDLFDIPRDVCFLNAGSWSPLPFSSVALGKEAVMRKAQPWSMGSNFQNDQVEAARLAAAKMIGAESEDIAITPSISYGVATAAKTMNLPAGSRVIVLADDHSSPVLEWTALPSGEEMSVRTVSVGSDGDWTAALLSAIEEDGPKGLALVSASNVHWADGGLVDMGAVSIATHKWGAKLLIDATHAVGVIDMDVTRLDPDFMLFPTYKWLLGPYGRAFLYVAKRWQNGVPLEQTMSGRIQVRAEDPVYFTNLGYKAGAYRFDMGEMDFLISLDMARHGMDLVRSWGQPNIMAYLEKLTQNIAQGLERSKLDVSVSLSHVRAPHILCVSFPGGMPTSLPQVLKTRNVHIAPRLGKLRISPHVYNDERDCDYFVSALSDSLEEAKTA